MLGSDEYGNGHRTDEQDGACQAEHLRIPLSGRPEKTGIIESAALLELSEAGYVFVTVDRIAKRAGVSKATIYRRWETKRELPLDAIAHVVALHLPGPAESGSLEGDITQFVHTAMQQLSVPAVRSVALDMLSVASRDAGVADQMVRTIAVPRRHSVLAMLTAAQQRGELPADIDMELAVDLVGSTLFFRLVTTVELPSQAYLNRLVHATIAAIRAAT